MSGQIPVSDGVTKEVLRPGTGPQVQKNNTITVQCTGSLAGPPVKKFWRCVYTGVTEYTVLDIPSTKQNGAGSRLIYFSGDDN